MPRNSLNASPMVTVSIPAYNRVVLLRETLRALSRQTFTDFEVLVSDNASLEDLATALKDFPNLRTRHVRHEVGIGMVKNWQYSLLAPKTKYVAWLHDDDLWEPDHLERAIADLELASDANFWSCATRHFRADKTVEMQTLLGFENATERQIFSPNETLIQWIYRQNAQCSSAVFRRSALDEIEWGPVGLCHRLDYFILSQSAISGKWIYDPKPTAAFRVGNTDKMSNRKDVLAPAVVQTNYVVRHLLATGLSNNENFVANFIAAAETWPVLSRAVLFMACRSFFASKAIKKFSKKWLTSQPEILFSPQTSKACYVAKKVGLWVLPLFEASRSIKCNWWPFGNQRPDRELISSF